MTVRVYSQKNWPGRGGGPLDDCWVLATYMAMHEAAPWLDLPGIRPFRDAAGAPDTDAKAEGGTEVEMYAGLSLWPEFRALCTKMSGWTWRRFLDEAKVRGRPAALIVLSDKLPRNYGFTGPQSWHAVSAVHEGSMNWRIGNPLDEPHDYPDPIDQPTLRAAVEAYRGAVYGVLMPRPDEAIALNPYHATVVAALQRQVKATEAELAQVRADLTTCQGSIADAFATGHAEGVTDGRKDLTQDLADGKYTITVTGPVTLSARP